MPKKLYRLFLMINRPYPNSSKLERDSNIRALVEVVIVIRTNLRMGNRKKLGDKTQSQTGNTWDEEIVCLKRGL